MTITADEKEKKDKHLQNCLEMRKVCTPTITVSVDGIAGRERLVMGRRGWPPTWPASGIVSVLRCWCMVYYVRVGMAIAVGWSVRTTASSFVAAGINNGPPSSPMGLP
jgi:hypothetical protein